MRSAQPQTVRFCTSADGTRIAYAVHGTGPPLVVAACWFSHLQHDWQSPVWRHFLDDLGQVATMVRYDERGSGLSDGEVDDFSLEARVADLAAVVDAAGLDRFALMGMSNGGGPSIRYASDHPDRVSRLVFYNTSAAMMPDPTPEDLELNETFVRMVKVGYGRPDSTFRRVFTSMMIPSATEQQKSWLDDLQRTASTAETTAGMRRALAEVDVRDLLPHLGVPTLVLHSRGDHTMSTTPEAARRIHNGRGLTGFTDDEGDVAGWPEVAYESIRAINHLTFGGAIPAPLVYDVLGNLKGVGHMLPQALTQLGDGLLRSLDEFDVYDNRGDARTNATDAAQLLMAAAEHAAALGATLEAAQVAINSQGYRAEDDD